MDAGRRRGDDRIGGRRAGALRGAGRAIAGALCLALAGLGGCYDYAMATVMVRDRSTLEPIPDATVTIGNTSLLNPVRPEGVTGETDAEGEVTLKAAAYNRLLVRVSADGYGTILVAADHPAVAGDSGWIGPTTDEDGGRARIEIRLLP